MAHLAKALSVSTLLNITGFKFSMKKNSFYSETADVFQNVLCNLNYLWINRQVKIQTK